MKNPVYYVSLLFILAASAIIYTFVSAPDSEIAVTTPTVTGEAKPEILSYVPADTVLFFGGLKPAPFKKTLEVFSQGQQWMADFDWSKAFNEANKEKDNQLSPALKIFSGMVVEYNNALKDPDKIAASLGFSDNVSSAIYMTGAIPVLRIKLEDSNAFEAFLTRAEKLGNVSAVIDSIDNVTIRSYSLDTPDTDSPTKIDLSMAVHDGYVVISLATPVDRQQSLKLAMGLQKPTLALDDTNHLQGIVSKYDFDPAYIGYISHTEIMKGLTNPEGNSFGIMLQSYIDFKNQKSSNSEDNAQDLASIQTPTCRKEYMEIAQAWPRSIFGYTKIQMDQRPYEIRSEAIIESSNKPLLNSLRSLRGFIPASFKNVSQETLLGFGLGLNMDAVAPFLSTTLNELSQKTFECESLKEMQQNLTGANNAGALGMATSMLAGIQGLSASIFSFDGSLMPQEDMPDIDMLDALISISTKNPQGLLMMAANFVPQLASIKIPEDGTAVDFPLPIPGNDAAMTKIAIKGSHIVVYKGDKAGVQANNLTLEPLQQNGLIGMNIDYSKYMKLFSLKSAIAESDEMTNEQKSNFDVMLKSMEKIDMQMNSTIDITNDGISFESITLTQ